MSVVFDLLLKGGPFTWLIFALGVLSAFIIIERALHLHRAQIGVADFLHGITNGLRRGNSLQEAISHCDDTPGPVASIVRAALVHWDDGPLAARRAMYDAALEEKARLNYNLKKLLTISHIAPLLGLLGTIVGMVGLFKTMQETGADITKLAGAIWPALLSTGSGLAVAIPCYGFYHFFRAQIDNIFLDMEKAASETMFTLRQSAPPTLGPYTAPPGEGAETGEGSESGVGAESGGAAETGR